MEAGREEDRSRAAASQRCLFEAMSGALDGCRPHERGLATLIDRMRASEPPSDPVPTHRASDPPAGSRTARIVPEDRAHTLSRTRAGKLVLTR